MSLTVAQLTARVTADTSGFYRGMAVMNASLIRSGGLVSRVTAGMGLATLAVGIMSVRSAGNFQQSMNVMGVAANASGTDLAKLQAKAISLGAANDLAGVSASDAAEGMIQLAKGGLTANQVIDASRGTMELAVAGHIAFGDAANAVVRTLRQFDLKATETGRVVNVLAAGAATSTAEIGTFTEAFGQAALSSHLAGVSVETTAGAIAKLVDAGLPAEVAGTALKTMFQRLAGPTEKAGALMDKMGISLKDSRGNFLPLPNIVNQFKDALSGQTNAQKLATLHTIFGARANQAMIGLMSKGKGTLEEYTKDVTGTAKAHQLAAARMKGFNGAMERISNAVSTMSLELGLRLLPALTRAGNAFAKFLSGIDVNKLVDIGAQVLHAIVDPLKQLVQFIAGHMDWFGPIMVGILAGVVAFKVITAAVNVFKLAMIALDAVMAANPIVLVAIAIAALVAAFILAYTHSERFKELVDGAFQWLKTNVPPAVEAVRVAVVNAFNAILPVAKQVWGFLQTYIPQALAVIKTVVTSVLNYIKGHFGGVFDGIKQIVVSATQAVIGIVTGALNVIKGVVNVVMGIIQGDWGRAWQGIKQIFSGVWTIIVALIKGAFGILKGVIKIGVTEMGIILSAAWAGIKALASATWSEIVRTVSAIFHGLVGLITAAAGAIKGAVVAVWNAIKSATTTAWNAVKTTVKNALGALPGIIVSFSSLVYNAAVGIGGQLVSGILDGLTGLASKLGSKIKSAVTGAIGWAGGLLHGSGDYMITKHLIGKPLADGVILGWLDGIKDLPKKISDKLKVALEAGKAVVDAAKEKFHTAFQQLGTDMTAAFEGATQKGLDKVNAVTQRMLDKLGAAQGRALDKFDTATKAHLDKINSAASAAMDQIAKDMNTALDSINASTDAALGAFDKITKAYKTPAEEALAAIASKEATDALNNRLSEAQANYDKVMADVDATDQDRKDAKQTLMDAQLQITKAGLEAQAVTERDAYEAQRALDRAAIEQSAADQKAAIEASAAEQKAGLEALQGLAIASYEAQRADQRAHIVAKQAQETTALEASRKRVELEYTAQRALEQRHFAAALAALEVQAGKTRGKHKAIQDSIIKLLASYGLSYKSSGQNLGKAFAAGLLESATDVDAAARAVALAVAKVLRTKSPTEAGPMSTLDTWWNSFIPTLFKGMNLASQSKMVLAAVSSHLAGPLQDMMMQAPPGAGGIGIPGVGGTPGILDRGIALGGPVGDRTRPIVNYITLHAPNYVGPHDELIKAVREGVAVGQRTTPRGVLNPSVTLSA